MATEKSVNITAVLTVSFVWDIITQSNDPWPGSVQFNTILNCLVGFISTFPTFQHVNI